jgi:hypothetical protein
MAKSKTAKSKKSPSRKAKNTAAEGASDEVLKEITKRPRGRPPKLVNTEAMRRQIRALAASHMPKKAAAGILLVHRQTFADFLDANPECAEAWEMGLDQGKGELAILMWRSARGHGSPAVRMQIHLAEQHLGHHRKVDARVGGLPGAPAIVTTVVPATQEQLAQQWADAING